jgi:outer membrane protein TolC
MKRLLILLLACRLTVLAQRANNEDRTRALVHDGAIHLSLNDAIALAIENNLDVQVGRFQLSIADADALRAKGGGSVRALDYAVAESPTGVGGPGSPLLNSAASSVTPTSPTVNDLTSLNILTETQANLSEQNPAGYATGPAVPLFDTTLFGQTGYFERSDTSTLSSVAGVASTPAVDHLNFVAANYSLIQGFSAGGQLEVDLNNAARVLYGSSGNLNPFSQPNTSITFTQPLLRGFGREVNLRYVRIAKINRNISRLLFFQQLIATVYGVSRLYYDLVSLNENAAVQRTSLAAAQKLLEDDRAQVEQGTLAPLELTRAQSLVTSTQLDLIQAEGLVRQQEVILKTQLSRLGSGDPVLQHLPIVPTDTIRVPDVDDAGNVDDLIASALKQRPDLAQANLQVQSGQISVNADKNARRAELDVIGNFQTRGSTETPFTTLGDFGTGALAAAPADLAVAGLKTSQIYQAGIQFTIPVPNRVAQADAARDAIELRQAQTRTQRLQNEVREDVENSYIALRTARSALDAAIQARKYQEQLVDAEKDKLTVGASTNFLVIQQESYLAQARSTEVSARSVWIKARVALDRSVGNLLEKNGVSVDQAILQP